MGRPDKPEGFFPSVGTELLNALEETYPDRCPELTTPEREVWAAAGRAEVVRFLRAKHQEQNETLYED